MRKQPRLTVEECLRLSVKDLRRVGLFRGNFGRWGICRWSDANGKRIRAVVFRLLNDGIAGLILEVRRDIGIALPTLHNSPKQMIPIVATKCNFGGERFWFYCPKVVNGAPCKRRVAVLYLLPGRQDFGCRICFNLSYRSVQEHDARIDQLLRLPQGRFIGILESGSPAERSLAFRALPGIRRRLEKQLAKYGRRQRSTA